MCAEIIYACVYGCISLYTNFIYVRLYICVQILYTCLLLRRCFIRRLEPPRKIFTTVKTADVYCRLVSVLRPTEKGQRATDCHSRHTSGSGAKQPWQWDRGRLDSGASATSLSAHRNSTGSLKDLRFQKRIYESLVCVMLHRASEEGLFLDQKKQVTTF